MKRRDFAASIAALAIASCNPRMDKRKKRYDEKECPFCVPKPGECSYCNGKGKCTYCNGTGKRKTSTKNYPKRGVERLEYEEDCPYCKASGKCRYCDGVGKCWACKGTGQIEDWNFYERHKAELAEKQDQKQPAVSKENEAIQTSDSTKQE